MALTAIIALTVGIGLANVGLATVEAVLFSRLPFDGGDRFVRLSAVTRLERDAARLTADSYSRLATMAGALEHLGAFTDGRESVDVPLGPVEEQTVAGITPSSLRYLPVRPFRGRLLTPDDGDPGREPVALVSEAFWRRALSASESAVGSSLEVGGTTRTAVGVLPSTFEFPNSPAIWIPLDEGFRDGRTLPDTDARLIGVVAPGGALETLSAQLSTVGAQLRPIAGDGPIDIETVGFTDLGPMATELSLDVVISVFGVLAVIAANVGNLVLARSLSRAREFSVRAALGASRGRLVAQVMVEVLVLGGIAAVLGSLAARVALARVNMMDELPFWVDFTGGTTTVTEAGLMYSSRMTRVRIGRSTVYHLLRTGEIPHVRFGRLIRIPRGVLEQLVAGGPR